MRTQPMRTLWGIMRELEHTDRIIDVVKIDREGPRKAYEPAVIRNLLEDGTYRYFIWMCENRQAMIIELSCIRQLVFELHFFGPMTDPDEIRSLFSMLKGMNFNKYQGSADGPIWHDSCHMNVGQENWNTKFRSWVYQAFLFHKIVGHFRSWAKSISDFCTQTNWCSVILVLRLRKNFLIFLSFSRISKYFSDIFTRNSCSGSQSKNWLALNRLFKNFLGLENVGLKLFRSQQSKTKTKLESVDDFLTLQNEKSTFMYVLSWLNPNPTICHWNFLENFCEIRTGPAISYLHAAKTNKHNLYQKILNLI